MLRYIEANPLRARIVERPGDYPWSSFAARKGLDKPFFYSKTSIATWQRHDALLAAGKAVRLGCELKSAAVKSTHPQEGVSLPEFANSRGDIPFEARSTDTTTGKRLSYGRYKPQRVANGYSFSRLARASCSASHRFSWES